MARHIPTGQLVAVKRTNLDECTEEELLQLMVSSWTERRLHVTFLFCHLLWSKCNRIPAPRSSHTHWPQSWLLHSGFFFFFVCRVEQGMVVNVGCKLTNHSMNSEKCPVVVLKTTLLLVVDKLSLHSHYSIFFLYVLSFNYHCMNYAILIFYLTKLSASSGGGCYDCWFL